mmetsp:Transcript_78019/g.253155  ORF Transcript_78019/g.253155 Transcript_78019/m.253155 type:complete len:501 (+) Transcript_78019:1954-3456(+)
MPGVGDAEEAGRGVLWVVVAPRVLVLLALRDDDHVVFDEVQTAGLAAARPERNNVVLVVLVLPAVDHLAGALAHLQPLIVGGGLDRDLVVPSARRDVLDSVGALVLDGLCAGDVVHAQHAALVSRGPVHHVIFVHVLARPLVVSGNVSLERIQGLLEEPNTLRVQACPSRLLAQLFVRALPANALQHAWVQHLRRHSNLVQVQLLGILAPSTEEVGDHVLVGIGATGWDRVDHFTEPLEGHPHLQAVRFVQHHDVVAALQPPWHGGDAADEVTDGGGLVLIACGGGRAGDDVLDRPREMGLVPLIVRVRREDPRTKHDHFDAEAKDQHVHEQVHGQRLVVLDLDFSHQVLLNDVPVRVAVLHRGLVVHAGLATAPRDRQATVVEGRRSDFLTGLEALELGSVRVGGLVDGACHHIQRAAPAVARGGLDLEIVQVANLHGVLDVRVLEHEDTVRLDGLRVAAEKRHRRRGRVGVRRVRLHVQLLPGAFQLRRHQHEDPRRG